MFRPAKWIVASSALFVAAFAWAADEKGKHDESEHFDPPKHAVAVLTPTKGNKVEGTVRFTADVEGTHLTGQITGLTPGKHGFHVHEFGDLRSTNGESAGGHFNPENTKHGDLHAEEHHAGDFGNIVADDEGIAEIDIHAAGLKLHFAIGRSIVVHAKADDLKTQPSGDSGPRVAVGVIGIANPKEEKSAKTAASIRAKR